MTSRSRRTWTIFAGCLLLVGLALFWVTREALDLERREAEAQREAQVHEMIRLSLWRMDSALAPILAAEAARSPNAPFWPPQPGRFAPFRLDFSIEATGAPSAPEIAPFVDALRPVGMADKREWDRAESRQTVDASEKGQVEYQSRVKMKQMAADNMMTAQRLVVPETRPAQLDAEVQTVAPWSGVPQPNAPADWINLHALLASTSDADAGPLEARWVPGPSGARDLFLVRTVRRRSTAQESLQGIWCDWPKLEAWLLGNVADLMSGSRLVPAPAPAAEDQATMLATIPARLVAGTPSRPSARKASPTRLILAAAWVAAIGAVAAVGAVLKAAMDLLDRRGRFVSAVTHELRTPLTTFRMYSQMLADAMVPETARPEYLATLRDESERLSRVVESVLIYSRLEEGRGGAHRERMACRALIERVLAPVRKRAADGGMNLCVTIEVAADAVVDVDAQAVEQILLNLVDNACKYARPADPRLEIAFQTRDGRLEAACRDHGPGVPARERDGVFRPFQRGERDAAGTTPGVGLGLAVARGLARALGGDLVLLADQDAGACFELAIPISSA
jgi:signal transduction histidine kinase